ncbi:hypothetical protein ACFQBQ_14720 [Granulicella cerasi]|uniref:Glycosyltransferase RgtA/B/C/D-like domain-containing protein n=1 Tax=Granulicella cerasi TaxID=741063 RepID=A0ABW1ZBE7_9BACT|nr:hypothetical protein [Granulicella cerasi]
MVCSAYAALEALSIKSFPLAIERSDMFAMIQAACTELLHGHYPYHWYYWPTEHVFSPYLPAVYLAYLPAVVLKIDPRWMSLFYLLLIAVVAYWAARPESKRVVTSVLAVFLVGNYLIYRHDLYLQPYWLVFTLLAIFICRGDLLWAAVALGVALNFSQLTLAIFPFLLLHAWQKESLKKAVQTTLVFVATAVIILGPFLWKHTHEVYFGIIGNYYNFMHTVDARPMNLAHWAAQVVTPEHLKAVQMAALVTIFGVAVFAKKCATAAGCLACMTTAFLAFIMLNILIDGYFYLTFLTLAMGYLFTANQWWRSPEAA